MQFCEHWREIDASPVSEQLGGYENLIEICSQGSNWGKAGIRSDNGLTPERQQAFIWTNDGLVYWHIYAMHYPEIQNYLLAFGCLGSTGHDPYVSQSIGNGSCHWCFYSLEIYQMHPQDAGIYQLMSPFCMFLDSMGINRGCHEIWEALVLQTIGWPDNGLKL